LTGNLQKPLILEIGEATTSLEQIVSVYPNPSTEGFNISLINVGENVKIEILDIQGRLIEHFEMDDEQSGLLKWNAKVQPGIYLIKIVSSEMNHTMRVVKQ
jgi:hypothetical protein